MDYFKKLLNEYKSNDEFIKNAKLLDLIVHESNNCIEITIEFSNVPTAFDLFSFYDYIYQNIYFADLNNDVVINFKYKDLSNFKNYYEKYLKKNMYNASQEYGSIVVLSKYNHHFVEKESKLDKDKIIFTIDEKFVRSFDSYQKILLRTFKKLGLDVEIFYEIDENLNPMNEIFSNIDEQSKIIVENSIELEKNREINEERIKNTKKFKSKGLPQAVSIREIPIDSYGLDKYKNTNGDVNFIIEGSIFEVEVRKLKKATLLMISLTDDKDAIVCKKFLRTEKEIQEAENLTVGEILRIEGRAEFDTYMSEVCIMVSSYCQLEKVTAEARKDKAKEKRIEFHAHSKMSNLEGVSSAAEYIKTVASWGHEAICFTDKNGLYAFPDIATEAKNNKIKPIYGAEFNFVDDKSFWITKGNQKGDIKKLKYVVFDIETTGFSIERDKIIEIGAVKIENGVITDRFQSFVNPEMKIPSITSDLTGITTAMVKDAPLIDIVLKQFLNFSKDAVLVAHNASFDMGHIESNIKKLGLENPNFSCIDTLNLLRYFYSNELKRFGLKYMCKFFKVELNNHHRAINDAEATGWCFLKMIIDLYDKFEVKDFEIINTKISNEESFKHVIPKHINLIAKNQVGYRNLFEISSLSLTKTFYKEPRLLRSILDKYREGIIIGSGCYQSEVFEAALNQSPEELEKVMKYYDYIEVQPPSGYNHLIGTYDDKKYGLEVIKETILKIIEIANKLDKIVIATSNAHYINKEDKMYRDIYIKTPLVGGGLSDLNSYDDKPEEHLRTTDEMLKEFEFLPETLRNDIVVKNTHKLNSKIEIIKAFPDELYAFQDDEFKDNLGVESITEELKKIVSNNLLSKYGKNPHKLILDRVEKELNSIITNNFASVYYISYLLVKKSLDDGYLVGSRGSVGSSLVATLMNITEVNPLPPHYYCPNLDFTVFYIDESLEEKYPLDENQKKFQKYFEKIKSGYDLDNNKCPVCKKELKKDGHDIPFETFLGFKGDKIPDIDLNFSGEYQAVAHEYVRELVGNDHAFRAGTISTVANKTAFGYVKKYLEEENIFTRKVNIARLASKIEGVKRSTGQHPGGIVVVPKNKTIYDVTPIQHPADDTSTNWYTTHFDYHKFESNLLKLDILGHDDPTMIKFLMDYVHAHKDEFSFSNAKDIPLDDKNVYKLFVGTDIIGVKPDQIRSEVASYAIPEFGTDFTRQMLVDTKPDSFANLVKISGLSHGTDVWLNNGQNLVLGNTDFGKISFDKVIGCRDDIMVTLINEYGVDSKVAFDIMEFVRKGKAASPKERNKWLEYQKILKEKDVPEWYIYSCGMIKYMFPKAHATAYVIMAIRIAWFKVYKPLLFYSAFFSKRAVQFDHDVMVAGATAVKNKLIQLEIMDKKDKKVSDEDLEVTLKVALEMLSRGFTFKKVDINKSEAKEFVMDGNSLIMPLISIDGLGDKVAYQAIEERNNLENGFKSLKEVLSLTKINKTVIEKMKKARVFEDLEEDVIEEVKENKHDLFSLEF